MRAEDAAALSDGEWHLRAGDRRDPPRVSGLAHPTLTSASAPCPEVLDRPLQFCGAQVACTKEIPREQKNWAQRGSWHSILEDVKLLKRPIKIPGQLVIWNVRR